MMKYFLFVQVLFLLITITSGACPNKCSGHGSCSANDVCICQQNWLRADCSGRQCPFSRAWQDAAIYSNEAHYYAECGNRGTCDRITGQCDCDEGFTGSGCRRLACPSDCSGHGTCEFIEDFASETYDKRIGGTAGFVYNGWDQEKIMGCKCDPMWEGHACEYRVCPKGDDALITSGRDMQQYLYIDATGLTLPLYFFLTYFDPYGNAFSTSQITIAATSALTCANVLEALSRLPNKALYGVSVQAPGIANPLVRNNPSDIVGSRPGDVTQDDTTKKQLCIISFPSGPGTTGYQNLLSCDTSVRTTQGYQPVSSGAPAATCTVGEHVLTSGDKLLTELLTCSGRGLCDSASGLCQCFSGHRGLACEKQEALV